MLVSFIALVYIYGRRANWENGCKRNYSAQGHSHKGPHQQVQRCDSLMCFKNCCLDHTLCRNFESGVLCCWAVDANGFGLPHLRGVGVNIFGILV